MTKQALWYVHLTSQYQYLNPLPPVCGGKTNSLQKQIYITHDMSEEQHTKNVCQLAYLKFVASWTDATNFK